MSAIKKLPYTTSVKLLDAVTVDTTGETYAIGDRMKMSIQFVSANNAGSGAFTVQVSDDGTNWVAYNRLISNVVNTNTQNDIRGSGTTLNTATSQIYFIPDSDHFEYIRANVDVTTAGIYSAILHSVIDN